MLVVALPRDGETAGCNGLGGAYMLGLGVAVDVGRALAVYEYACEYGNAAACTNAGMVFSRVDPALAMQAFADGCELGEGESCVALAAGYREGFGVAQDLARAESILSSACERDVGAACGDLALGVAESDPERLRQAHARACELDYGQSCGELGRLIAADDPAAAVDL